MHALVTVGAFQVNRVLTLVLSVGARLAPCTQLSRLTTFASVLYPTMAALLAAMVMVMMPALVGRAPFELLMNRLLAANRLATPYMLFPAVDVGVGRSVNVADFPVWNVDLSEPRSLAPVVPIPELMPVVARQFPLAMTAPIRVVPRQFPVATVALMPVVARQLSPPMLLMVLACVPPVVAAMLVGAVRLRSVVARPLSVTLPLLTEGPLARLVHVLENAELFVPRTPAMSLLARPPLESIPQAPASLAPSLPVMNRASSPVRNAVRPPRPTNPAVTTALPCRPSVVGAE